MEDNPRHISILLKRMSVLYGFVIIQANGIPGYRLVGMASGSMSERVGGVLVVLQGLSWKVRLTLEGTMGSRCKSNFTFASENPKLPTRIH